METYYMAGLSDKWSIAKVYDVTSGSTAREMQLENLGKWERNC